MDLNVTLLGEMLTFTVLVWVVMKYIWPPLIKAIEDRQKAIADGLEAAEHGKEELKLARTKIVEQLQQTKAQAALLVNKADQQASELIAKGKAEAETERSRIMAQTKLDLKKELEVANKTLQKQTADLIIKASEKILQKEVDEKAQKKLIDQLISSI